VLSILCFARVKGGCGKRSLLATSGNSRAQLSQICRHYFRLSRTSLTTFLLDFLICAICAECIVFVQDNNSERIGILRCDMRRSKKVRNFHTAAAFLRSGLPVWLNDLDCIENISLSRELLVSSRSSFKMSPYTFN
jgi:hypothetical protein